MGWKNIPDRIFNLLIVNSLHRIEDEFNIHGLVSGTIVSIYGLAIGLAAWFLFVPLNLIHSALIVRLGIFAYLAILNHHILELIKSRGGESLSKSPVGKAPVGKALPDLFLRAVATIFLILVYLLLVDTAIGLGTFFITVRTLYGIPNTLLWSLPGLVALVLPLFLWEPLCRVTPVDEIVERAFK